MKNAFDVEFQIGNVHDVNTDGTIDIFDYRTGSILYKGVVVDMTAADMQLPIKGHDVLYFTVTIGAMQKGVKIVKFFESRAADSAKVRPSGVLDIQPGEKKMMSQGGSSVFLANRAAQFGSVSQSITFDEEKHLCELTTKDIKILTTNGYLITQTGTSLVIQRGIINPLDGTIPLPTVSITINDTEVDIESPSVSIGTDASKGVARVADSCGYIYFDSGTPSPSYTPSKIAYGNSPTPPPTFIPTGTLTVLQVQVQAGSLTVQAAD